MSGSYQDDAYEQYKEAQAKKGEPALNINAWYKQALEEMAKAGALQEDGFEYDSEEFDIT